MRETLLIAMLTAVAALLRLPALGAYPPGLQGDEAWLGLEAQRINRDGWIGIWTSVGWGQPTGLFYWAAALLRLLPDTSAGLRATMALLAVATIPLFYLMVRALFGWRAALLGTALLVFSYWHIHYSRTAFTLIGVPLFSCAVLLPLTLGLKRRRGWLFAVAGVITGVGLYTYRGYPFLGLFLALLGVLLLLARPYLRRLLIRHLTLFAAPAVLLAVPMLWFILHHYDDYADYGDISLVYRNGDLQAAREESRALPYLLYKGARALGTLSVGREPDSTDGLGSRALLDPLTLGLFTVGMSVALVRWRRWQSWLLWLGLLLGLVPVALSVEWGENRRGIVALPFVFAAAGVGGSALLTLLERLGGWLFRRHAAIVRGSVYTLAIAALAFVAGWNVWVYFYDVAPSRDTRFAYAAELSRAAELINSLDGAPYVYFYSDRWSWDYEARRFQVPDLKGEDRSREFGRFSLELRPTSEEALFLLAPPYIDYLDDIERRYPGGARMEVTEGGKLLWAAYYLREKKP